MKCHYETLNLQRTADDSDIKTAYRKLALKWHPDKNLDDPENAKEQFQLVQAAYEVLSDPQERAWYDNHREQILRGGHTDYEDNSLDVFQYFTASCYKGFGDDSNSFYYIYADVFNKIASEDIEYMESELEFDEIPRFGNSKSSYEDVVGPFYAYWQSYCTKKSYAWLCPHNIAEIRDRRVLKVIEKETKKIQQKARKERNESVRSLVAFVRKRDKRVQANKKLLEEKALHNRAKLENQRIEQILKRKQELEEQCRQQNNVFDTAYEKQLRQLEGAYAGSSEDEYLSDEDDEDVDEENVEEQNNVECNEDQIGELDDNDVEEEELEYYDELYCVACNKTYKNHGAYQNHESSKKHRDNILRLKNEMLEEEASYEVECDDYGVVDDGVIDLSEDELKSDSIILDNAEKSSENEIDMKLERQKKKKKSKKQTKNVIDCEHADNDSKEIAVKITRLSVSENDDWSSGNTKKTKKSKVKVSKIKSITNHSTEEQKSLEFDDIPVEVPQKIAKPKRGNTSKKLQKNDEITDINTVDINHTCVTCSANFDSKNKLFNHLKKFNHGVYIPKPGSSHGVQVASANDSNTSKKNKKKK